MLVQVILTGIDSQSIVWMTRNLISMVLYIAFLFDAKAQNAKTVTIVLRPAFGD